MYGWMDECMYVRVHVCVYVSMCVCTYVYYVCSCECDRLKLRTSRQISTKLYVK